MKRHLWLGLVISLGCVSLSVCPPRANADEPALPKGMEVLTRGPIHEAFAEPVDVTVQATPALPKAPPDPIAEVPPDQKPAGDNVLWIPGYWAWDNDRNDYIWVSGVWRTPPDGQQWVPGYWQKTDDGWQWVPGFWKPARNDDVNVLPPPPDNIDEGPSLPAPGDNYFYSPGVWVYRDARYFWRPGNWIKYRLGLVWVPAHYVWTPLGWIFVDGYWDLPLEDRGLLFAPVWLDPNVIAEERFLYTPNYVVCSDFLFGSLFIRSHHHHYYFGDYFGDRYARDGFTPWVDFRFGRRNRDPLFDYYSHSRSGSWTRDTQAVYATRAKNEDQRPPRSLQQQTRSLKGADPQTARSLTVLTPITQVDRKKVELQTISRDQIQQVTRKAEETRAVAQQRRQVEQDLLKKGSGPSKPSDPPRTLKLDVSPKAPTTPQKSPAPVDPSPPSRHEHKDPPPTPKVQTPPPPPKVQTPPPPSPSPPPPPRKDPAPSPPRKVDSPPKVVTPPPPNKDPAPSPPKHVREFSTPAPSAPAPSKPSPPPAPKVVTPPPQRSAPPPPKPAPKVASPPPAPKVVTPPPAPKVSAPPPPPARHASPPPPAKASPPPPRPAPPPPPPPSKGSGSGSGKKK